MSESAGKRKKWYIDRWMSKSKSFNIDGPGHSSDGYKVLWDFGFKYAKGKPTKYHVNHTIQRKKFNRQLENNEIINNVLDEILLNEAQE